MKKPATWLNFVLVLIGWNAYAFPAPVLREIRSALGLSLPLHHGIYLFIEPIRDPNLSAFKLELSSDGGQTWILYDDHLSPSNSERIFIPYRGRGYALASGRNYTLRLCAIYSNQETQCIEENYRLPQVEGLNHDLDLDGLSESEEFNLGTDPLNPDSDFDDISDRLEFVAGIDPSLSEFPLLEVPDNFIDVGQGNPYGDFSTQHPVVFVTNRGQRPLRIREVSFESEPANIFEIAGHFRLVRDEDIPPGNRIGINVDFLPQMPMGATAKLTLITDDRKHFPMEVDLVGHGKGIANMEVRFHQAHIVFPETQVGDIQRGPSITVANVNANTPLRVRAFANYAYNFLVSPDRFEIPSGEEREIHVDFLPEWSGSYEAALTLQPENEAKFRTYYIPIFATAEGPKPTIRLEPQALDFPETHIGRKRTKRLTIHNDGEGPLFVKYIDFGEVDEGSFSVNRRRLVVPPGGSSSVNITFAPVAGPQEFQAHLCILSNDPQVGMAEGCGINRVLNGRVTLPREATKAILSGSSSNE